MNDCWQRYESQMLLGGSTQREAVLRRERDYIRRKMQNSLSYHHAIVDGNERELVIINSDNLDTKTVIAMPGEDIRHGATVEWMNNYWIVTAKDANTEVYSKGTMRQCNYLLKWIDDGQIVERWCIIEDGTKYLTGEMEDRNFIVSRGDSRVSMLIPLDDYTLRLNRKSRFLIDDYFDDNVLAYRLTKPFKLGRSYGNDGVLSFVLVECNTEKDDNLDLHIADYYKYFPRVDDSGKESGPEQMPTPGEKTDTGRKWL